MPTDETTKTCDKLMTQLKIEQQKESCISALGGETLNEVTSNANALIRKASRNMIIAAIQKYEGIKGKAYAAITISGVQPPAYAGIPETLLSTTATVEEVAVWYDQIIKTSFANGTKYQPLPSHDEAWQTFSRVRTELTHKRFAADQWLYTLRDIPEMSNEEVILAARWGFWGDLTLDLKRKLFKLLPPANRIAIQSANLGTTRAMQAVQDFYNNPATIT